MILPKIGEIFDTETESKKLKDMVGIYDPDAFIRNTAHLLRYIGSPRIEIYPFQGLDSPLRQLYYITALNLSSDSKMISEPEVTTDELWKEIVMQTIRAKAGYYDLLLPKPGEDTEEFNDFYKVAMPVFMNYYDTGKLNYEEQEIERIERSFEHFEKEILAEFGLDTTDMLAIYEHIDDCISEKLNSYFQANKDPECSAFFNDQKAKGIHPNEMVYTGDNPNILALLHWFQTRGELQILDKQQLYERYDKSKIDQFLNHFTIIRTARDFYYYTQVNPLMEQPIYQLNDGRLLIFEPKQILHAIFSRIEDFLVSDVHNTKERYFRHRGKYLHKKTSELFERFFKGEAFLYNEYRTAPDGDGQDLLALYKRNAMIVEIKAGYEAKPHAVPSNTRKVFEGIYINFKRNIQKGFEQAQRVMEKFHGKKPIPIYDENNKLLYTIDPTRYENVVNIIVTQDKFRKPQIDLSLMLKLKQDHYRYPFSVCIDDLEIIFLTLRKLKKSPADFFRFLKYREQLQGRLDCDDELQLWGAFINNPNFSIPDNPDLGFKTFPKMGLFYDDLYEKGLGFKKEKNWERKTSGKFMNFDPGKFVMNKNRMQ